MNDFDDEDDMEEVEKPTMYAFKAFDLIGATAHMLGRTMVALGSGLQDIADLFAAAAWQQREDDVDQAELAKDRNTFDAITALPVLPEERS